jgi:hypothetical protein
MGDVVWSVDAVILSHKDDGEVILGPLVPTVEDLVLGLRKSFSVKVIKASI